MAAKCSYKPIGGVVSVLLYPSDSVGTALFSTEGCEVEFCKAAIEVELLDDSSYYEEKIENRGGILRVSHTLHLKANRLIAEQWTDNDFLEQAATDGLIADVKMNDGRHLLVGYSKNYGDEQPLRLEYLISSSGTSPSEQPTTILQLVSMDTEFSQEIL